MLAALALSRSDWNSLNTSAEQIIASEPFAPDGYLMRAAARFGRRNPDSTGGEADLKKAIELAPLSPVGYSRLGSVRMAQNNFKEAEKLFEQALEKDANSLEAMQGLVGLYQMQKQVPRALARLDLQLAKVPNNPAFFYLKGTILFATNDLEKAQAAFEQAANINKDFVDALLSLGQVQGLRAQMDKAAATFQQCIEKSPRDVRAYILLASLEEGRNNWQRAQELYEKSLQVAPDNPLASNNLAFLQLEHGGNVDVALSHAQIARQKMPDRPNVADTLGWAYYHKGIYGQAITYLEEAVKGIPDNPTYHYHLGRAYQKAADPAKARLHLKRALELNPKENVKAECLKSLAELGG